MREIPCSQWIPSQRASGLLYFLWYQPKETVEQTVDLLMIWEGMMFMWCQCHGASMCNIHPCSSGLHHCYQCNDISMGLSVSFRCQMARALIQYKDDILSLSHCGNKTAIRSSYLHNGISYADKIWSLYKIWTLVRCTVCFVTLNSSQIESKFLTLIWGNLLRNKTLPLVWYPQGSRNHQAWYWHIFALQYIIPKM